MDPRNWTREVIRIEAEACARNYGIDPERVLGVFERLARHHFGDPLPDDPEIVDAVGSLLRRPTPLDHALRYLPADAALAVCEAEDLGVLEGRAALVAYLSDEQTPLYTVDELEQLVVTCGAHLERNRGHLLRTGHPVTALRASPWLGMHLAPLYPVKLPLGIESATDEHGDEVFTYTWPNRAAQDRRLPRRLGPYAFVSGGRGYLYGPDGVVYTDDGKRVKPCSYERAALIAGLSAADAARLEEGRQKFFHLKTHVLQHLAQALRTRDAAALWLGALGRLTDAITADEADFYLRMDAFYRGYEIRTGQVTGDETELNPGGLTDLLEVIGHCELELIVGTMDRMKRNLLRILPGVPPTSYYEAIGQPWRQELDAALGLFGELESEERAFWEDFRRRVNDALENEFSEEVVIRTKVKRKLVARFEPQVRMFAEFQKAHLEANGVLPALSLHSPEPPTAGDEYVSRREGEFWTLQYGGRQVWMKHAKGLADLAILLSRRGQPIPAVEVEALSSGRPPAQPVQGITNASRDQLAQQGLHIVGTVDDGATPDLRALGEYRRQYRDVQAELRDAEDGNDVERASRLREQIEWLADEMARATGLGGRRRNVDAAAERARKRVSARIEDAIRKIERQHPALGRHLRNSVETGATCSYSPEANTAWVL